MEDFPEYDMLDGEEEPLFGDDVMDDDPPPLPPPMPSLSELSQHRGPTTQVSSNDYDQYNAGPPGLTQAEGSGIGVGGDGTADKQITPQKKRKPILTLKVDRIFSDKGLPWLEKEFPKLKFKGKGHEASDLKYLMQQYEHWANALYPKLTFSDLTDRIEALAKKREFKSRLVQMRRRHMRGGATTPPLSDNEDGDDTTNTNTAQHSDGTNGQDSTEDDRVTQGIQNGEAPDANDNLEVGHMVTDRDSVEDTDHTTVSNGDGQQQSSSNGGRFSETALSRLTMDGLDSSDDDND